MKKHFFFVAIASVGLLFTACKTMQIEKPTESYLPSSLAPALSELPLPAELDVKKLEAAVNKKLTGLIYDGTKIANKDLSVKIWKAQNFTFSIHNNVIEYRIPLKIWTNFTWKVQKFGLTLGDHYEATGSIALTYKTTIGIDKNWKLTAKTSGSGYEWLQTPKINAVGVTFPVTPVANLALSQCDKLITAEIDKLLAQSIDLKKYINTAWTEVQKPRQVSAENNLWLRVTPKDVYVSPFSTTGNKLNLAVALYAQIESFMGAQPGANAAVSLPDFKYVNRPAQQLNLNVGADVTFDKISEMAKKQLQNKTFTEGGKTITITDLSIFGSGGKAVFVADVVGSFKGRIYFTGNMVYDPEKIAVSITNPEFSVKTSNALVKSASWLLHGMILKKITPFLTYPISDTLEKMKADANKMLGNYSIMEGVALQGKMNSLTVTDLSLVPGAARVQANVKGTVAVKVQDLKF